MIKPLLLSALGLLVAITGFAQSKQVNKNFGMTWVLVEGGPTGDFLISSTEVTFDQYDRFCAATGHKQPKADFGRGKQPVINVNVTDALAFCEWLSKETGTTVRLPENNEWVYAASGGNKSKGLVFSGSNVVDDVAWYEKNSGDKTHEVGTKKPNELGIYDMSGNVWEWCGALGDHYGGSWRNASSRCEITFRATSTFNRGNYVIGFRIVQKR